MQIIPLRNVKPDDSQYYSSGRYLVVLRILEIWKNRVICIEYFVSKLLRSLDLLYTFLKGNQV